MDVFLEATFDFIDGLDDVDFAFWFPFFIESGILTLQNIFYTYELRSGGLSSHNGSM